ncbi:putative transcriptional regulator [Anoxybacillus kamchatkensis]|uniref:helix-turn-helix domain-containing protein n=1 Tax=Anoxybacillus ayderensis TaxID=265546 RepID=UPI0015EBD538|nr:helix-turn-helix transcriptional regulator [Anoxybacillus ayderensis]MBA2878006.1 putative transcriptional regulator [Anoxybacillus ayderensis]
MKVEVKLFEMMARNNIRQIKELHEMTGISRTVISDLLNGNKRAIRLDTIARLCEALNCSIGDLIVIKKDKVS